MDSLKATGRYVAELRSADGELKWKAEFDNLLTQTGKGFLLDEGLAGSAYTAATFMGLVSSVGFTAISGGDTPTSHAGWVEAGSTNAPTYSGSRATLAWAAATVSGATAYSATKALNAASTFTFTGTGTVEGAFIVIGAGASATIGNTGGTLYNVATLASPLPVVSTDVLTVAYSTTLT